MIVETKEVVLFLLVVLQDLLEVLSILHLCNISGSAVKAMSIRWSEWFNMDTLLFANDCLVVVKSSAILALKFALFNCHHDIVRQAQVDERVHSTSVLFKHLCFSDVSWEIGEDESISTGVRKPQKFQSDFISDLGFDITIINVFFNLQEKWMVELLSLASELGYVLHDLGHRNNRDTHINTESLDDLILEGVRGGEEHDLWVLRPSLQKVFALIGEHSLQHVL